MKLPVILLVTLGLICASSDLAQINPVEPSTPAAQASTDLAKELAQRLSDQLHSKTAVGQPIHAGSVTLIPILLVDVNFAGGAMPASAPNKPGLDGFLISGEARPLGFVAITPKGTHFVPVVSVPAK